MLAWELSKGVRSVKNSSKDSDHKNCVLSYRLRLSHVLRASLLEPMSHEGQSNAEAARLH